MKGKALTELLIDGKTVKPGDTVEVDHITHRNLVRDRRMEPVDEPEAEAEPEEETESPKPPKKKK